MAVDVTELRAKITRSLKSLTHPLCIARPVVVYEPGGPQKLL